MEVILAIINLIYAILMNPQRASEMVRPERQRQRSATTRPRYYKGGIHDTYICNSGNSINYFMAGVYNGPIYNSDNSTNYFMGGVFNKPIYSTNNSRNYFSGGVYNGPVYCSNTAMNNHNGGVYYTTGLDTRLWASRSHDTDTSTDGTDVFTSGSNVVIRRGPAEVSTWEDDDISPSTLHYYTNPGTPTIHNHYYGDNIVYIGSSSQVSRANYHMPRGTRTAPG